MASESSDYSVIFSAPPIVESIFRNLPMKDLKSCAQVCKLWNRIVDTVKKERKSPVTFFYFYPDSACDDVEEYYDFYDAVKAHLPDQVNNSFSDPKWTIFLCTKLMYKLVDRYLTEHSGDNSKKLKPSERTQRVFQNLLQYFPPYCKAAFCVSYGVVGTCDDNEVNEIETCPSLAGIILPSLPGCEILQFSAQDWKNADFNTLINCETDIKCVLFFLSNYKGHEKFITDCLNRCNYQLALGGAIVKNCALSKENKATGGFAVVFAGDKVEATSLIIKPSVRTPAGIEEKLKKLKKSDVVNGNSIAFMFACVARGTQFYKEDNVESSCFRRIFPKVPLIGVFGDGEIGLTYFPNQPPAPKKSCRLWRHSYCTVFVLISIKE